uniref:NADH dehydrogenase subunit 2 n=1 Tax=Porphyridium aerugineum TaxID=2792 RepID=UPI001FCD7270|nr:NADH dehydrogenase subunit 2 [Porphyridium aerugineum]UNJ18822.1 NADH dehydrogenase subunit 2 [Porphyridium aerugineum]
MQLINFCVLNTEIFRLFVILSFLRFGVFLQAFIFSKPIRYKTFSKLTFFSLILWLLMYLNKPKISLHFFDYIFYINYFSLNINLFLSVFFILWLLLIQMKQRLNVTFFEFWILILCCLLSFHLFTLSYDLRLLYLFIERQSITLYILASFNRTFQFATEAGLKYFIFGSFASCLLLFALSIIYMQFGITNLFELQMLCINIQSNNSFISFCFLLVLISIFFKLGAAPFHLWMLEVYEGVESGIRVLFTICTKIIFCIIFIKLIQIPIWLNVNAFFITSLISILIGTFAVFIQVRWKRFLIFASIVHIGWMLIPNIVLNINAQFSLIFYLVIYTLSSLSRFACLFGQNIFNGFNFKQKRYRIQFLNMRKLNPTLSIILRFTLFSFAGIPPFIGFLAKLFVLVNLLQNYFILYSLVIILLSLFSRFYYLYLIKLTTFQLTINLFTTTTIIREIAILLSIFSIFILEGFLYPNLYSNFIYLRLLYL